jgi:DNA-binding transcriptional LysR family regulator
MADRRLQVFHAVAKHGSFTRAADSLAMTQPAVTFQIKQLEESFNTRLFDRGHGRIDLTPAGRVVLEYAERILALTTELDARVREMTDGLSGPLAIGASMTIAEYLLPRILGEFRAQYPDVQASLTVGNSETIEARVLEHTLDVGLLEGPAEVPPSNLANREPTTLMLEVCGEDELMVIAAPNHPLAMHASVEPNRLLAHAYVSRERGSGTREFTDIYLRRHGVEPARLSMVMALGSPEAVKGAVETGAGFAVMSRAAVVKELRLGTLRAIPLDPRLIRTLSLVFPREKFRSRLVNTFVEFAKARLRR